MQDPTKTLIQTSKTSEFNKLYLYQDCFLFRRVLVTGCDERAGNFLKETYGIEIAPTMRPVDPPQVRVIAESFYI